MQNKQNREWMEKIFLISLVLNFTDLHSFSSLWGKINVSPFFPSNVQFLFMENNNNVFIKHEPLNIKIELGILYRIDIKKNTHTETPQAEN